MTQALPERSLTPPLADAVSKYVTWYASSYVIWLVNYQYHTPSFKRWWSGSNDSRAPTTDTVNFIERLGRTITTPRCVNRNSYTSLSEHRGKGNIVTWHLPSCFLKAHWPQAAVGCCYSTNAFQWKKCKTFEAILYCIRWNEENDDIHFSGCAEYQKGPSINCNHWYPVYQRRWTPSEWTSPNTELTSCIQYLGWYLGSCVTLFPWRPPSNA